MKLVKMVLQDDGVGAEQVDGGFGLLGMRERVHLLNGNMEVITGPNKGFRLEVILPE
jgi:signal transduction histidine kinase